MLELTEQKSESEHQLTMWYHNFSEILYTLDALEMNETASR